MKIIYLEPFKNLVDKSFLSGFDLIAIHGDLKSREPMELSHNGDFQLCLESQNSGIN
jgi:hypothetical protein